MCSERNHKLHSEKEELKSKTCSDGREKPFSFPARVSLPVQCFALLCRDAPMHGAGTGFAHVLYQDNYRTSKSSSMALGTTVISSSVYQILTALLKESNSKLIALQTPLHETLRQHPEFGDVETRKHSCFLVPFCGMQVIHEH